MFHRLQEIGEHPAGGKAKGLLVLKGLGLSVPEAFVIVQPGADSIPDDKLDRHLAILGEGPKAVRSSAVSEDGHHASFAGQFETYLNITGREAVAEAISRCVEAATSDRVREYTNNIHEKADTRISVIIQNMVDADKAGVIFTADPVSNRRDKLIIDVVEGNGDELVSGRMDAVHYEIFRSGKNIETQAKKNGGILTPRQLHELVTGALKAQDAFGYPVDLEWAIDKAGNIQWLQVRPVTTLDDVHFNELDDVRERNSEVWSLGNIGEMMPGVVTPLTYSISCRTIDIGLGYLAAMSGAIPMREHRNVRFLQMFYNRLFFNMSHCMVYVQNVAFNKKENIVVSLSAVDIPELVITGPMAPAILRFPRFLKQIYNIQRAGRNAKAIMKLEKGFNVPVTGDLIKDYEALNRGFDKLVEAFCHHNMSSAQSGYYYSVLTGILTSNKREADAGDHYLCSLLLSEIPDIESADAVKSMEKFTAMIREESEFAARFLERSPEEALDLLVNHSPGHIRAAYEKFIARHGHRCVKESELREKPWEEDQAQLIVMLQATLRAGHRQKQEKDTEAELKKLMSDLNATQRFFIRFFKNRTRRAVVRRETTKAASMKMLHEMRKAYRKYAELLVGEGLLDDTDQVFFLTHEEIGKLIRLRTPSFKIKAEKRRKQLPETAKLRFNLMNVGIPEPIGDDEEEPITGEGQIRGIPVSSGIVEGTAHVVNNLEEASTLQKGEIMVVSYTDIGWTPYFSIISGLVTEIGSPLSHGAVVAREYGIPAIVSVKGARTAIRTGMRIRLDGNKGVVEIL